MLGEGPRPQRVDREVSPEQVLENVLSLHAGEVETKGTDEDSVDPEVGIQGDEVSPEFLQKGQGIPCYHQVHVDRLVFSEQSVPQEAADQVYFLSGQACQSGKGGNAQGIEGKVFWHRNSVSYAPHPDKVDKIGGLVKMKMTS